FDAAEAERVRREWLERAMPLPLEVEEAEFRDLGDPLLDYLRGITADPDTVAVVIMPELIFSGSSRLLHNQRALYIKRLLLFEPRHRARESGGREAVARLAARTGRSHEAAALERRQVLGDCLPRHRQPGRELRQRRRLALGERLDEPAPVGVRERGEDRPDS